MTSTNLCASTTAAVSIKTRAERQSKGLKVRSVYIISEDIRGQASHVGMGKAANIQSTPSRCLKYGQFHSFMYYDVHSLPGEPRGKPRALINKAFLIIKHNKMSFSFNFSEMTLLHCSSWISLDV